VRLSQQLHPVAVQCADPVVQIDNFQQYRRVTKHKYTAVSAHLYSAHCVACADAQFLRCKATAPCIVQSVVASAEQHCSVW
jgi:hypothetical protein